MFKFTHFGKFAGKGELFVDGKKVDEIDMPRTHVATFSLSEPFDVGVDNGTPVAQDYPGVDHFPFTGSLDKVVFRLLDDPKPAPAPAATPAAPAATPAPPAATPAPTTPAPKQ